MTTHLVSLFRFALAFALGAVAFPAFAQTEPVPFPASATEQSEPNSRVPQLVTRVDPLYPESLRGRQIEADVHVAFVVDQDGKPTRVRAFFSHFDELEAPAIAAVQQWRFTPGVHLGRVVKTQMIVAVHFIPPPAKS